MDETERQRLLAQYSEIATLAGGLAHEIRNPLSTMSLNLELLIEEVEGSDNPRDMRMLKKLQKVQKEAEQLNELLNDFLPQPCDVINSGIGVRPTTPLARPAPCLLPVR